MRRVVGGDHVDRAVLNAFDKRQPVLFTSKRRIHLEFAVFFEVVFIQQQIVRRGFTGDVDAARLCLTDQLYAFLGGDMADVIAAACLFTQTNIPLDRTPFGLRADSSVTVFFRVYTVVDIAAEEKRVIFTVSDDQLSLCFGSDHCLTHHLFILYASAVVGEGDAFVGKTLDIRDLFSFFTHRDSGVREHVDDRVFIDDILFFFHMFNRIQHRGKVRHCAYCGVAASCRRL